MECGPNRKVRPFSFCRIHRPLLWRKPMVYPTQHTNGKIYGLAPYQGDDGQGVAYSLDMGLGPFVSLVSTWGRVGRNIEVLGQGFTGTTAASVNGTPATYTIVSDTFLGATVPAGATTGFVTVTTPSGTLTSNQSFRVRPQLLSFNPPSGPVGTGVSLTQAEGLGFGDSVRPPSP